MEGPPYFEIWEVFLKIPLKKVEEYETWKASHTLRYGSAGKVAPGTERVLEVTSLGCTLTICLMMIIIIVQSTKPKYWSSCLPHFFLAPSSFPLFPGQWKKVEKARSIWSWMNSVARVLPLELKMSNDYDCHLQDCSLICKSGRRPCCKPMEMHFFWGLSPERLYFSLQIRVPTKFQTDANASFKICLSRTWFVFVTDDVNASKYYRVDFAHDFEFWFSKLHYCCLWCSTDFFLTDDLMSGSRK